MDNAVRSYRPDGGLGALIVSQLLIERVDRLAAFIFIPVEHLPKIQMAQYDILDRMDPVLTELKPVDPEKLHMTLLYIESVKDDRLEEFFAELNIIMPVAFTVDVTSSGTFPEADDKPVVLHVNPSPALIRLQSELYNTAFSLGFPISVFSSPGNFKPHISLAYGLEPANTLIPDLKEPITIPIVNFQITRPDYELIRTIYLPTFRKADILVTQTDDSVEAAAMAGPSLAPEDKDPDPRIAEMESGEPLVEYDISIRVLYDPDLEKEAQVVNTDDTLDITLGPPYYKAETVEHRAGILLRMMGLDLARRMLIGPGGPHEWTRADAMMQASPEDMKGGFKYVFGNVSLMESIADTYASLSLTPEEIDERGYVDAARWIGYAVTEHEGFAPEELPDFREMAEAIGDMPVTAGVTLLIERHTSPIHPGTGTDQQVHAGGAPKREKLGTSAVESLRNQASYGLKGDAEAYFLGVKGYRDKEAIKDKPYIYWSVLRPLGSWTRLPEDVFFNDRMIWSKDPLPPERIYKYELGVVNKKAQASLLKTLYENENEAPGGEHKVWVFTRETKDDYKGFVVHPSTDADQKPWRASTFDLRGFSGHSYYDSPEGAISGEIGLQTWKFSASLFEAISQQESFSVGNQRSMLRVQRESEGVPFQEYMQEIGEKYPWPEGTPGVSRAAPDEDVEDSEDLNELAGSILSMMGLSSTVERGGPGSGHFGHLGRPRQVGGSQSRTAGLSRALQLHFPGMYPRLPVPKIKSPVETMAAFGFDDRPVPLARKLEELRNEIAPLDYEMGYFVTPDGEVVFEKTNHEHDTIIFSDEDIKKLHGNILVHNHPLGKSLSKADVFLAAFAGAREVHAYGKNGHIYVVRINNELTDEPDEFEEFGRKVLLMDARTTNQFVRGIRSGHMTPREADDRHNDEVWTNFEHTYPEFIDYEWEKAGGV